MSVRIDEQGRAVYAAAWERWRRDIEALHAVLLDDKTLDPPHFVALLRRESKSKAKYEEARQQVLGLPPADEDDDGPFADASGE